MKRVLILIVPMLLTAGRASAQTPITGTVSEEFGNERLSEVVVADSSTGATVQTDENGRFALPCRTSTTVTFTRFGYEPARRVVQGCGSELQVTLQPRVAS